METQPSSKLTTEQQGRQYLIRYVRSIARRNGGSSITERAILEQVRADLPLAQREHSEGIFKRRPSSGQDTPDLSPNLTPRPYELVIIPDLPEDFITFIGYEFDPISGQTKRPDRQNLIFLPRILAGIFHNLIYRQGDVWLLNEIGNFSGSQDPTLLYFRSQIHRLRQYLEDQELQHYHHDPRFLTTHWRYIDYIRSGHIGNSGYKLQPTCGF